MSKHLLSIMLHELQTVRIICKACRSTMLPRCHLPGW